MVYGCKANKPANSTDPNHKRRISLLNADFKIISGIYNSRLKGLADHTLSKAQFLCGGSGGGKVAGGGGGGGCAVGRDGSCKIKLGPAPQQEHFSCVAEGVINTSYFDTI